MPTFALDHTPQMVTRLLQHVIDAPLSLFQRLKYILFLIIKPSNYFVFLPIVLISTNVEPKSYFDDIHMENTKSDSPLIPYSSI